MLDIRSVSTSVRDLNGHGHEVCLDHMTVNNVVSVCSFILLWSNMQCTMYFISKITL